MLQRLTKINRKSNNNNNTAKKMKNKIKCNMDLEKCKIRKTECKKRKGSFA